MKYGLDNLHCDAVEMKPRDFDFGEGYGETWETVRPSFDDFADLRQLAEDHGVSVEPDDDADGILESIEESDPDAWSPMMNYIYPLPPLRDGMTPEEAQAAISDAGAVVVVYIDERGEMEPYLALSGGGMDLSWDICRAYLFLGFLPPIHYCDLPDFAGTGEPNEADILAACLKSCEVAGTWAEGKARRLKDLKLRRLQERISKM